MTDARNPERWLSDRRFLRLSGDAYKLYSVALMWAVSNRTDGVIEDDDLPLLPGVDPNRVDELSRAGLWNRDGQRWQMVDFLATQTSRDELAVLENARRRDREAKARKRAARKEEGETTPDGAPPDDPPDTPRDVSGGQHRQGKARTGQDRPQTRGERENGTDTPSSDNPDAVCLGCGKPRKLNTWPFINGLCSSCSAAPNVGRNRKAVA